MNLIAYMYLAYIAGEVATVSPKKRGKLAGETQLRGQLDDHFYYNQEIKRALKFIGSPDKCPSESSLITSIQKKANKAQKAKKSGSHL